MLTIKNIYCKIYANTFEGAEFMKRQFDLDKEKFENKELCSKCKQVCCKKCGCAYYPEDFDFELTFENLKAEIDKGFISIDNMVGIETPVLKLLPTPIHYLRVRNINEDTPIAKNRSGICKKLDVDHCQFSFEERPSGGKYYIPFKRGCYSLYTDQEFVDFWLPYQKVLVLLLEHYSKK